MVPETNLKQFVQFSLHSSSLDRDQAASKTKVEQY